MPFLITSILSATDLSPSAAVVLRAASAFAELTEAELHVVHAVPADEDAAAVRAGSAAAARRLREQLTGSVPDSAKVASTCVAAGSAHEVILERAADVCADLIVIGPHSEGSGTREALGTTADRLVRTSDVPCLIVPRAMSLPLRCVLVPSDLSAAGRDALDVALVWAAALRMPTKRGGGTRLVAMHVLPRPAADADPVAALDAAEQALRDQLAAAGERTGFAAVLSVSEEVIAADDAAAAILRCARERAADLVVMGTHGEGALGRALIGGTSSTVARQTDFPLLMVPPGRHIPA
jgi:universal stress protein E